MGERYHYVVSGRVQGVGYRFMVYRIALKLDIKGYVRNLDNGDVEIYAEGSDNSLKLFKEYLKKGSLVAKVTSIFEEKLEKDREYTGFKIIY